MNKYPDTRNKLDNNKPVKKKKPTVVAMRNLQKAISENPIKELPLKLNKEKKPSKGSIFKKATGYSKTMKRNMKKSGAVTVESYKRDVRKTRKLAATKLRQKKHSDSVAYKRANGKKGKSGKQAIKAPKTAESKKK